MSDDNPSDFARQLELAWAAGFFDGEGTAYLCQSNRIYYHFRLALPQVERGPLERFQAAVGGAGIIGGPYKPSSGGGRPIHRWRCNSVQGKEVLKKLWPYLCEVKRAQATKALAGEIRKFDKAPGSRTHCPQGHAYDLRNTAFSKRNGDRHCRKCDAIAHQQSRAKKALERAAAKVAGVNNVNLRPTDDLDGWTFPPAFS
jgi:hypothetical protein